MNVQEAIENAEALLPGKVGFQGKTDPRWQAIIALGEFRTPELFYRVFLSEAD
jgi:hypothetical protein